MTKKPQPQQEAIPDIRRGPVILPVQCGHCLFHKRMATYSRPCVELGTPASAQTCSRFTPDPAQLSQDDARALSTIASAKRPLLLASIMLQAKRCARIGWKVGEIVYLRITGGDYLNNYASGMVVGATRDQVILIGYEGYTALLFPDALLDRAAWETKRQNLVSRKAINDPAGGLRKIGERGAVKLVAYEPAPLGKGVKRRKAKRTPSRDRKPYVINLQGD